MKFKTALHFRVERVGSIHTDIMRSRLSANKAEGLCLHWIGSLSKVWIGMDCGSDCGSGWVGWGPIN